MKKSIYLSLFICMLCTALFAQVIDTGFSWDNENRNYRMVIPSGYVEGEPIPMVFNFHGFGSNGFEQQLYSQMDAVAEENNFILVYPHGLQTSWNVGWLFGSTADDVGFVNAMIDTISASYTVNPDRIYSCGMSNGGFFSYRLACELGDRIAKVASVTGSMLESQFQACTASPIPVMQIHGTADAVVNYNGTPNVSMPIEDLLSGWSDLNSCPLESDTIFVEDISTSDNSTAQLIQYRNCSDDSYMAFYKIAEGGHTWPGSSLILGVTNQDFNASKEIWRFFDDQYPIDELVDNEEINLDLSHRVAIYPNPITDRFKVSSNIEDIESIVIYNALGQLVAFHEDVNSRNFELNNISWDKGFYFIKVKTERHTKIIKIIRQN